VHPSANRIAALLERAGATGAVQELAESTRTAAEAAAAVGCPVGAIANSLVFMAGEQPVLILTSGGHRVDTAVVAEHMGGASLRRATADEVREATGQAIGGVAPLGHPRPLRALIDLDLRQFDRIWASAGTPNAVFPTTFEELRRLAGAEEVAVARPPQPDGQRP
jgi:prolyl-tRNA editing enzyme YbaK/EbsC (Cys-tRNA(Pro) deacylase)